MRSKEIKRQSFDRGDPDPLSDARNRCRVSTTLLLLLLARGFISINSFFIRGECEKGLLANGFQPLRIFALFWASICVKLGYHARRARPGETGLVDLVFPVYFITFCLPPHSLSPSYTIDSIPSNLQFLLPPLQLDNLRPLNLITNIVAKNQRSQEAVGQRKTKRVFEKGDLGWSLERSEVGLSGKAKPFVKVEVTRGIWNVASMNGADWPSLAANLSTIEQHVKKIIAATGVDVPSLVIVFHHNSDVVVQLLKSCFTSTLGCSFSNIYSNGGVGTLIGHGFGPYFSGGISPVAPGIVYLCVHRSVRDVLFMTEEIVSLLLSSVKDIASNGLSTEKLEKLKKAKYGMRYGQVSFTVAMTRVKVAASLGASLVWISGGLNLVQSLMTETLPSWFISVHGSERGGESGGMVYMLGGYTLAYFAVFCGAFSWGVDTDSRSSQRRPKVLEDHLEFLASTLDGKISLGCDGATWRAYVSGFVSLLVACTPKWIMEIDVDVLKWMIKGLREWNEEAMDGCCC
ncbi:hypothetical protein Ddye_003319 [Dipteronia dyeriana]|uniref:Uncharacterized protein n=1 Tax=Dipteronia dyeriana TaxID=168575 RepID=A0AAD9XSS9_9ROSI|nr:hypothetical protein Ddye_003319 [Dipteronia dyeriana]